MRTPQKCNNVECHLFHQNIRKNIRSKQSRQHQELIALIDSQTKIISNLTHQLQCTANQVITLIEQSRLHLNNIPDSD